MSQYAKLIIPHHYAATDKQQNYYIKNYLANSKNHNTFDDDDDLTNKQKIVFEFLAYQFYSLVCRIPKVYIAYEDTKEERRYYLASRHETDYQDLADYLKVKSYADFNKDFENNRAKLAKIEGLGNLLVMAALLFDNDVIGAGLRNVGVVPIGDNRYAVLKIDPGNANCVSKSVSFYKQLVVNKDPLVTDFFKYAQFARGIYEILGPAEQEPETFGLSVQERLLGIYTIASISEQQIREIVYNPQLSELLSVKEQEQILNNFIVRQKILREIYQTELAELSDQKPNLRPYQAAQQIVRPLECFMLTDQKARYGRTAPKKYLKLPKIKSLSLIKNINLYKSIIKDLSTFVAANAARYTDESSKILLNDLSKINNIIINSPVASPNNQPIIAKKLALLLEQLYLAEEKLTSNLQSVPEPLKQAFTELLNSCKKRILTSELGSHEFIQTIHVHQQLRTIRNTAKQLIAKLKQMSEKPCKLERDLQRLISDKSLSCNDLLAEFMALLNTTAVNTIAQAKKDCWLTLSSKTQENIIKQIHTILAEAKHKLALSSIELMQDKQELDTVNFSPDRLKLRAF